MSYLIKRAVEILREDGPLELSKRALRFVHTKLPKSRVRLNGIPVRKCPLFDPFLPWRDVRTPNYESGILSSMEEHVNEGDEVVVVGGGFGVTGTKAAKRVGERGNVIVYEGSLDKVERTEKTARLNRVSDRVEVRHAVVGPSILVWGEKKVPHT